MLGMWLVQSINVLEIQQMQDLFLQSALSNGVFPFLFSKKESLSLENFQCFLVCFT